MPLVAAPHTSDPHVCSQPEQPMLAVLPFCLVSCPSQFSLPQQALAACQLSQKRAALAQAGRQSQCMWMLGPCNITKTEWALS